MRILIAVAIAGTLSACGSNHDTGSVQQAGSSTVPLFDDLGTLHFRITAANGATQRYFDQGLRLTFAFNHEEAINSFTEGTRRDSSCAMCWWGIALAHGPNINAAMETTSVKPAFDAVTRARALAPSTSPIERALIEALAARYAATPSDRASLDSAYARAMRIVATRYGGDPTILALYAESLLDLRPWNQWTKDGRPQPGTLEVVGTLERAIAIDSTHPGACHYYIHTVEASPDPERALPCAERLPRLMPGAGHVVHMPAHLYIRTGRFADAVRINEHAMHSDQLYLEKRSPSGIYPLAYAPHNAHFLFSAASFAGMKDKALAAARDAASRVPLDVLKQYPGFELFTPAPYFALVQFGDWNAMLATSAPDTALRYTTGMWLYARGRALAATGKLEDAARAAAEVERISAALPRDQVVFAFHSAAGLLALAAHVLRGDIAEQRGDLTDAIRHYRLAILAEDALLYDEPPPWYQPVRHFLGAALLKSGDATGAERAYRDDLRRFPENGWSLLGLVQSLKAQGKDAADVDTRLARAWRDADVTLSASRM